MKKHFLLLSLLVGSVAAQAQWVSQPVPFSQPRLSVFSLDAVDDATAWASAIDLLGIVTPSGGGSTEFARTTNGGATWQAATVGALLPGEGINSISAISASTAWISAVGGPTGGRVLRTTDGGATWQAQTPAALFTDDDSYLNFVYFFDASHGLCVGDPDSSGRPEIYVTADGGTTWARAANVPATLPDELLIEATRPTVVGSHIWFSTDAGRIYHSPDRGTTWTVGDVGIGERINGLAFQDATTGLAVHFEDNRPNTLFRTTDGGATWVPVSYSGPLHGLGLVQLAGTSNYLSVGATVGQSNDDKGSSYSRDGGVTWTALEATQNHILIDATGPLTVWTSAYNPANGLGTGVLKLTSTVLPTQKPQDHATYARLNVYPNPSRGGQFTVQLPAPRPDLQVRVCDALGRVVLEQPASSTTFALDLSHQPAGIYSLEMPSATGVLRQRVVVQ